MEFVTEFARNHSGSVESKDPSRRTRRCGRQPKWPSQKRPEEDTRGRNSYETTAGIALAVGNLSGPPQIRAKPQREYRNTMEFATEFARNHSGSVESKDPSRRTRRCGRQPKWPSQKRPEEDTRSLNSCETTVGASKYNGIRVKPQWEHRNATEFTRNHSGSVETKDPSRRARRCGRQPKWPPLKRPEEATRGRNSCEIIGEEEGGFTRDEEKRFLL